MLSKNKIKNTGKATGVCKQWHVTAAKTVHEEIFTALTQVVFPSQLPAGPYFELPRGMLLLKLKR
jgi:hypothetical protein